MGDPNAPFPRPVLLTTYDNRLVTPLSYNWNLTLEREVVREWLARIAYVGSASNYGRITKQLNPARYIPGNDAQGRPLSTTANTDSRRLFAPEIGNIDYFTEDRRSHYHSMQLSLTKRMSRGFTIQGSYTLSKDLGNLGVFGTTKATYGEVAPLFYPEADKLFYVQLDFNINHRIVEYSVQDMLGITTIYVFVLTF